MKVGVRISAAQGINASYDIVAGTVAGCLNMRGAIAHGRRTRLIYTAGDCRASVKKSLSRGHLGSWWFLVASFIAM